MVSTGELSPGSGRDGARSFPAILGHFWPYNLSKTPDSEFSHRADHSAPIISYRGLLRLEIQAQIVSSNFLVLLLLSVLKSC